MGIINTLSCSPDIDVNECIGVMGSLQLGGIAPGGNRVTSPTEHLGGIMRKEDIKARAAFQYREKKKELAMSMRRVKAWIEKHAGDADRVADLKDYLRRLELEDLFWTKHRKNKKG